MGVGSISHNEFGPKLKSFYSQELINNHEIESYIKQPMAIPHL